MSILHNRHQRDLPNSSDTKIAEYTGNILLVGISYDKETTHKDTFIEVEIAVVVEKDYPLKTSHVITSTSSRSNRGEGEFLVLS